MDLKLNFSNEKNIFIKLPESFINYNKIKEETGFIIENNDHCMYVFWTGLYSENSNIQINGLYACKQGFKNDERVKLKELSYLPKCQSVFVEPESFDDWEIIEFNAVLIEKIFLSQARLVYLNQIIPIWTQPNLVVFIKISQIIPQNDWSILEPDSEICISPVGQMTKESNFKEIKPISSDISFPKFNIYINDQFTLNKNVLIKVRLYKLDILTIFDNIDLLQPFDVILSNNQCCMPKNLSTEKFIYLSLSNLEYFKNNIYLSEGKSVIVRVYKELNLLKADEYNLFCTKSIFDFFNLDQPVLSILKSFDIGEGTDVSKLMINTQNASILKDEVIKYMHSNSCIEKPFLINNGMKLYFSNTNFVYIFISDNNCSNSNYTLVDNRHLDKLDIEIKRTSDLREDSNQIKEIFNFKAHEEEYKAIKKHLAYFLNKVFNSKPILFDQLLISGAIGSGKTHCFKYINSYFDKICIHIFTKYINCTLLKNKVFENLYDHLMSVYNECSMLQPSIIFLDNLDDLTSVELENNKISSYYQRVALMIVQIHKNYTVFNKSKIMLIATCQDAENLNHVFFKYKFFNKNIFLEKLNFDKSTSILQYINSQMDDDKNIYKSNINHSNKLEINKNYSFYDLENIAAQNIIDKINGIDTTSNEYILISDRTMPNLYPNFNCSRFGGLKEIRNMFIEIIGYPIKYKNLFLKSPLRSRTGILLYGPSGTGKTLLMKSVITEFKMNHLFVNGPELLNKFIGASEAAVKNVFHKARSMTPCILLFDEFDSIASKRGNDNTGVTDRVVNQLLMELDGIDSLSGVYVIASTNRKDLIDPALLRPGRLDQSIYCGPPDLNDRIDILSVMSEDININMDLSKLAKMCEGFTGADIKSLLYNAFLMQLRENDLTFNIKNLSITKDSLRENNSCSSNTKSDFNDIHLSENILIKCIEEIRCSKQGQSSNDNIKSKYRFNKDKKVCLA